MNDEIERDYERKKQKLDRMEEFRSIFLKRWGLGSGSEDKIMKVIRKEFEMDFEEKRKNDKNL